MMEYEQLSLLEIYCKELSCAKNAFGHSNLFPGYIIGFDFESNKDGFSAIYMRKKRKGEQDSRTGYELTKYEAIIADRLYGVPVNIIVEKTDYIKGRAMPSSLDDFLNDVKNIASKINKVNLAFCLLNSGKKTSEFHAILGFDIERFAMLKKGLN